MAKEDKVKKDKGEKKAAAAAPVANKAAKKASTKVVEYHSVVSRQTQGYATVVGTVKINGDSVSINAKRARSSKYDDLIVPLANIVVAVEGERDEKGTTRGGYIITDHPQFVDYAYSDVLTDVKVDGSLLTGKNGYGNKVTVNVAKLDLVNTVTSE